MASISNGGIFQLNDVRVPEAYHRIGSGLASGGQMDGPEDLYVHGAMELGTRLYLGDGNIYMDRNGPDGDQRIWFHEDGSFAGERLYWDDSLDRFTFTDDLRVDGSVSQASSIRYKEDVAPLEDPLETVQNLRGVSYSVKETGREEIGFIAEELYEVLPEVVTTDDAGVPDGVDYSRLTAVLTGAVQEQQTQLDAAHSELAEKDAEIQELEERLTQLEELVAQMAASS